MASQKPSTVEKDQAHALVLSSFLERINFSPAEAKALAAREPNTADLGELLGRLQLAVPFENLGQHVHPAGEGVEEVPRSDPTLETQTSLRKIIFDQRGGFCWEINYAFIWLLRSLGYKVRVSNANVITPNGPMPGHLCMFVDGLGSASSDSKTALLVDPGFGDSPRALLPVTIGEETTDSLGDVYKIESNDESKYNQTPAHAARFDMVLTRSRKVGMASSPIVSLSGSDVPPPSSHRGAFEAQYLFSSVDDCALDCQEFKDGLAVVLSDRKENLFSQKRFCMRMTETGYVFVGTNYCKVVEGGVEKSRRALESEREYREALKETSGVVL